MLVEHDPRTSRVMIILDDFDEIQAVVHGLDSDRNHPARAELYDGLLRVRHEKESYWRHLAAFGNVRRARGFGRHVLYVIDTR